MSTRRDLLVVLASTLITRWWAWREGPLWLDEAVTLRATLADDPLAWVLHTDLHPPLLVALLALLGEVADPVTWARWPSLLASIATPFAGWWAGRAWGGARAGLVAGLLLATCPPLALYAGEARPYALGVLALTVLLAAARRGHDQLALAAAVAAGWSLWGAWPVIAVVMVGSWRRGWLDAWPLRWTALALAPATPLLVGQRLYQPLSGALAEGMWSWRAPYQALLGRHVELLAYLLSGHVAGAMWRGVGLAAVVLALRQLVRRRGPLDGWLVALVALFWTFGGLGWHPYAGSRHLLVLAPIALLWAALSTASNPRAWGLLVGGMVAGLATQAPLPSEDAPAIVRAVQGEAVWVDASLVPAWTVYGGDPRATLMPWVDPAAIDAPEEGCLVWGRSRHVPVRARVRTWVAEGWRPDRWVVAEGAWAVCGREAF